MSDIEKILREDARHSIADGGFAARVLGALPARAVERDPWLRPALVLGSAALGSVLATLLAPAGGSLLQGFADLVQKHAMTPAAITGIAIGGALLASALVLTLDLD